MGESPLEAPAWAAASGRAVSGRRAGGQTGAAMGRVWLTRKRRDFALSSEILTSLEKKKELRSGPTGPAWPVGGTGCRLDRAELGDPSAHRPAALQGPALGSHSPCLDGDAPGGMVFPSKPALPDTRPSVAPAKLASHCQGPGMDSALCADPCISERPALGLRPRRLGVLPTPPLLPQVGCSPGSWEAGAAW